MRSALALALAVVSAHAAHADVAEPAPTPLAPPATVEVPVEPEMPPAVPPAPDPRVDAAWTLYHRAFVALEDGDRATAADLLAQLIARYPRHPASTAARQIAGILKVKPTTRDALDPDRPSTAALTELGAFQTIHGAVLGVEICALLDCNTSGNAGPYGLALLGAGAGALITLAPFDTMKPSTRSLVNSGTVIGFSEGLLGTLAAGSDVAPGPLLLGQLVGIGAGLAITSAHPTAGQVALAMSGSTWTTVIALLGTAAIDASAGTQAFGTVGIVGLNLGLAGGIAVAMTHPRITRGQTLILDAAALAGGAAAGAIATFVTNDVMNPKVFGLAALGATAGLVTAVILTPELGAEPKRPALQTFVIPAEHGRGALVGAGLSW